MVLVAWRRRAAAAALGVAWLALPAVAQPPEPVDLGPGLVRLAIELARGVAEIRYDAIVVDRYLGATSVTGLAVETGLGPVRVRELALSGDSLASWLAGSWHGRVAAYGLELPPGVTELPEEMLALLSGGGPLLADVELESGYDLPSGVLALTLAATLPDSGRLELAGRLRGLRFDPFSGEPAGRIEELALRFSDDGLTERVIHGLAEEMGASPDEVRDELGQQLQAGLEALLRLVAPEPAQAPPALLALKDELGEAVEAFLAEPGTLALTLRPPVPLAFAELEEVVLGGEVERLGVHVATLGAAAPAVAPVPGDTPAAQAAAARHYLDGIGVPQSFARAAELAAAAAAAGDAEGAMIEAELLARGADPAPAYAAAARAAALGQPAAAGLMARLEARMTPEEIAAAQEAALAAWRGTPPSPSVAARAAAARRGEVAAMRDLARAFATGTGVPRSFREAYVWASLAAAAGDRLSAGLRDRLAEAAPLSADALTAAQAEAAAMWQEMARP